MIVAVVLTFAAPDGMLEDCVDSLLAAPGIDRLVVVDNGRRAHDRLAPHLETDSLDLIVTDHNLGFAGGMNVGLRFALERRADLVLILNDDLVVEPDFVAPLVDALDADPRVGAVQPKLLLAGTSPVQVNSLGVVLGSDGAGRDIGLGDVDDPADGAVRDIGMFTGGCVLLRADYVRDVGLFDERYFLYYEDVDLALRGAERGWQYRCIPSSRVLHRGGVSTLHASVRERTIFLRERNRVWILFRHRSPADVVRGCWLSVRRLRWPPRGIHARALVAGLSGGPRLLVSRWRATRPQIRPAPPG